MAKKRKVYRRSRGSSSTMALMGGLIAYQVIGKNVVNATGFNAPILKAGGGYFLAEKQRGFWQGVGLGLVADGASGLLGTVNLGNIFGGSTGGTTVSTNSTGANF
jgi:hypothetical protein